MPTASAPSPCTWPAPLQDPPAERSRSTIKTKTPTAAPNPAPAASKASGHEAPAANLNAPASAAHPVLPKRISAARTSIIPAPFTPELLVTIQPEGSENLMLRPHPQARTRARERLFPPKPSLWWANLVDTSP
ncbi:hypothetical protein Nans01_18690 [Nocardiopsis ansamitocini]|uniref:Uncharacterized protein n=1 Tax=Nocardiopsis ansamitocini TaxID=1670832 RepID=A0A9W6P5N4_9ACTN|nr:hypothetical protein Nans01_18690 [Nocardiopsis ansamitocini]